MSFQNSAIEHDAWCARDATEKKEMEGVVAPFLGEVVCWMLLKNSPATEEVKRPIRCAGVTGAVVLLRA